MGLFTYHFVSPNQEQLQRRRELLDGYGQFAQLSALVPLFAIFLLRVFLFLEEKYTFAELGKSRKEHASPVVSRFAETVAATHKRGWSEVVWARVQWWLDDEVVSGWGTWREWVVGGSWAVWLMVLAMRDTGDGTSIFISLLDVMIYVLLLYTLYSMLCGYISCCFCLTFLHHSIFVERTSSTWTPLTKIKTTYT